MHNKTKSINYPAYIKNVLERRIRGYIFYLPNSYNKNIRYIKIYDNKITDQRYIPLNTIA